MPFGLKNDAQAFQHLMDTVCRVLNFLFIYMDDILVASSSWQEHCAHLRLLCQLLSEHDIVINPDKYQFGPVSSPFWATE